MLTGPFRFLELFYEPAARVDNPVELLSQISRPISLSILRRVTRL